MLSELLGIVTSVINVQLCLFNRDTLNIFASALRNTISMPHQGEILQEAIKNSGISITRIVDELGITRPTIYRKFKDETVDYSFVKRIGEIINHDFSDEITSVQQSVLPFVTPVQKTSVVNQVTSRVTQTLNTDADLSKQLLALQTKYIALLESYNELLLRVYGPK
ncbi:helix-turn-helix domain-containing protein [Hymenobacter ruber]